MGSMVQREVIGGEARGSDALELLRGGVVAAIGGGSIDRVRRWLDRELDEGGAPRQLPVSEWLHGLALLAEARRELGPRWSTELDARVEGYFLQTLRFMRPDGSLVFGSSGSSDAIRQMLWQWAEDLSEPGFHTVLNWWFPGPSREFSSPPLPASARPGAPLATLRADWLKTGDLIAVDHRASGSVSNLELVGLGRTWLGPRWGVGDEDELLPGGRARTQLSVSNSTFDLVEWSFRAGEFKVGRTALLLRGRRLALLADQVEGRPSSAAWRIAIREGIEVIPSTENRSLALTLGPRFTSPRLIPLAVPYRSTGEERGRFRREGNDIVLRQSMMGKRGWLPMLISWDAGRNRRPLIWRPLTVSEGSKICEPQTAVAYRVAWGRDESLVIYQSLGRPVPRSFLGHKTKARFLVGLFNKEGNVEPLATIAD